MQTHFTAAQLANSSTTAAAAAIRSCVHCGFCTATCPTYVLLGNELDSPRGRIMLVKDMLEKDALPSAQVVEHLDRCLSCLACETTCPSGVSYRRIIDAGRAQVDARHRRPLHERWLRAALGAVLPYRRRFRVALWAAAWAQPLAAVFERSAPSRPWAAMLRLARAARPLRPGAAPDPAPMPAPEPVRVRSRPATLPRVGLMRGCVEPVLDPGIQAAAERLLVRAGCQVVRAGEGCCGALSHHLGHAAGALIAARAYVDAWHREIETGGLDALLVTASGCGTSIRDYVHLLRDEPVYAKKAARVAALACDVSELLLRIGLPPLRGNVGAVVGYHPACSLQHGQRIHEAPPRVLAAAGFTVRMPRDAHLCCGSAGVYNILQPELAGELGRRKARSLDVLEPDVIATGNVGCRAQIGLRTRIPVVHVVELLDWATGGPRPFPLRRRTDLSNAPADAQS